MLALISTQLLFVPSASAATMFEIEVGRFFDETDHSAESMRFFPSALRVHQGDILHFRTNSFHSVTLLPVGQDATTWTLDNVGQANKTWSLFRSDPDEGAGAFKINPAVLSPSGACGWPTQSPCSFSGAGDASNGLVHSGLALFPTSGNDAETKQLDFSVKVLAEPGQSFDVLDVLHPGLAMGVEVVAAGEDASDPIALQTLSDAQFAEDQATATRLHRNYQSKRVKKVISGRTIWSAWAGVETPTVSLRRMYPSRLVIKKGDRVRWSFTKNVFSSHTVSFPAAKARTIAARFPEIRCDQDGDFPEQGTGTPDTAPTSLSPPYCASFSELELDVPARMTTVLGDRVVSSARDLASSGPRGKGIAISTGPYTLQFRALSGTKGFSYISMIYEIAHANTRGKVVVTR